jgi:hypothetical protein
MNNQTTFEETDAFGWRGFANKLEAFLITERGFVDGSLVVSLNAPFGSGKTTFIHMWKNHLDGRQESDPHAPLCILLNAWEDDYCGDPLLSLVDAIEKELQSHGPDKQTKHGLNALREATKDAGWFLAGMGNSVVGHWTGLDPVAAGAFAEAKKAKRNEAPARPDILSLFQARKESLGRLKEALRSLFTKDSRPVLLLVDELDRCRPDFAVQYLETIKHIFDVDGLAFVLAVDLKQLENSARALFGDGLDFPEYFRKFAHRNIQLPKPDSQGIANLVTKYTDKYIDDPSEDSPRRKSWMIIRDARRSLVEMSSSLDLTPRQIQEAFRIVGHLTAGQPGEKKELYYHLTASSIFLAFLSLGMPAEFQQITARQMHLKQLLDLVVRVLPQKNLDWWAFVLALTHSGDDDRLDFSMIQAEFAGHGIIAKDMTEEEFRNRVGGFQVPSYGALSLSQIARKITATERFAS